LDTYFVFLRTQVLLGRISSQEERDLTSSARELLQSQAADHPAYQHYLKTWDERLQQQHDIPAALGAST
ncbi:MAG: 3'-5' exonuclease, partial [Planctomycetaceae bacterium]